MEFEERPALAKAVSVRLTKGEHALVLKIVKRHKSTMSNVLRAMVTTGLVQYQLDQGKRK